MFNELHDLMQLTATTKSVFQMGKLLQFAIIEDPLSDEMEAIFKLLSKLEKNWNSRTNMKRETPIFSALVKRAFIG